MQRVILIVKWLFRAWPVLVPAVLAIFHVVVSLHWAIDLSAANKIISLSLQIVDGILVLYSIDSNIGIVNNQFLFTLSISWLKSFPLIKRSYVINAKPGSFNITGHPAKIRIGGPGRSTEEHLAYLQKQIEWLKKDLNDEVNHLKTLINGVEQWSSKEIS